MTLNELRYYRNLLTFEKGDKVEWCYKTSPHRDHDCSMMRGTITALYHTGNNSYLGMQNAFMVITTQSYHHRYCVLYTNPTLKKLETDK